MFEHGCSLQGRNGPASFGIFMRVIEVLVEAGTVGRGIVVLG